MTNILKSYIVCIFDLDKPFKTAATILTVSAFVFSPLAPVGLMYPFLLFLLLVLLVRRPFIEVTSLLSHIYSWKKGDFILFCDHDGGKTGAKHKFVYFNGYEALLLLPGRDIVQYIPLKLIRSKPTLGFYYKQ